VHAFLTKLGAKSTPDAVAIPPSSNAT